LTLSDPILCFADINLNSPNKGVLSDFMTDVPVDQGMAARTPAVEGLTEVEEEELRAELAKVLWLCCLSWGDYESRSCVKGAGHILCSRGIVPVATHLFCVPPIMRQPLCILPAPGIGLEPSVKGGRT
jgi:hypothetical protein